jgi:hypothetical protein
VKLQELLQRKLETRRPLVYCLCGSTSKATKGFRDMLLRLTLEGHIVLSIGANVSADDLCLTEDEMVQLHVLHLYKIDMSDVVLILNVDGHIGESTRREYEYAVQRLQQGKLKRIEYLDEKEIEP